ncbi:MAG TPA: hypothetical protein VMS98_09390 [Thermoanaerobaculia bacterium]|nr:hypothetical protein [Thermoanaerobaculia bacterium]
MEDIRIYPLDEDESWHEQTDEERAFELAQRAQDEVPFHIPRD